MKNRALICFLGLPAGQDFDGWMLDPVCRAADKGSRGGGGFWFAILTFAEKKMAKVWDKKIVAYNSIIGVKKKNNCLIFKLGKITFDA